MSKKETITRDQSWCEGSIETIIVTVRCSPRRVWVSNSVRYVELCEAEDAHFLADHLVGGVVADPVQIAEQLIAGRAVEFAGRAIHVQDADPAHAFLGIGAVGRTDARECRSRRAPSTRRGTP